MEVAEALARKFSDVLGQLHAAPSPGALQEAVARAIRELYPTTEPAILSTWSGDLAPASGSTALDAPPPASVHGHLLLELLWAHSVQCDARLRGSQTPLVQIATTLPCLAPLTPREREVLAHIALGETDTAIGRALGISPKTVGKHIEHLLEKLGVETRTAAVAAAYVPAPLHAPTSQPRPLPSG